MYDDANGDTSGSSLQPYDLQCEFLDRPLAIDATRPRLTWRSRSARRGDRPTRYQVVVRRVDPTGAQEDIWDSGPQPADAVASVTYGGPSLAPTTRYAWQVTLWDGEDERAGSADSWFETGMGAGAVWKAAWIGRDESELADFDPPVDTYATHNTRSLPASPHLRRHFVLDDPPVRARLYVTARGLFRCSLNGRRVGDDELAPGWTDYRHRIPYHAYDVTELLSSGENVLGAVLAGGWWSGFVGFDPRHAGKLYGNTEELLAQLEIDLPDGSRVTVCSDEDWREASGPIQYADLLMGEAHDARLALHGWDRPGSDTAEWAPVRVQEEGTETVEAARTPPVRVIDQLAPADIGRTADGALLIDFGQNLVGRLRLTVRGAGPGQQIVLTHAEMLEGGDVYLDNLRRAEARDVYVCAGSGVETFAPIFTLHGFRYARIEGYPGELDPEDLVAEVLQSDTPWTGTFECSDHQINQLYRNIRWGQSGNFVAVPTDCPQRDERLGWLADAQVFLPTACRNADVAAFFSNWMDDVVTGQDAAGAFPDVAPRASLLTPGAPAWGDAGVIIPWALYRTYGDIEVLERTYPAMRRWLDYVREANPDLIWRHRTGRAYGDWLQVGVQTPREVLATAYFARSADLSARTAEVLGLDTDAKQLRELYDEIRATFVDRFVGADGRVEGDTQTAYLLPLAFDLLPSELRPLAVEHLVDDIVARDHHLTTGFVGVSMLCQVLSAEGRSDVAYRLLHQETFPSWLFSVQHGATTIWERWDGWTPGGGFQSANMNSFNHYSLGAVGDWLFGSVAGIDQAETSIGYAEARLQPRIGGQLTSASAQQETARGLFRSSWVVEGDVVSWDVEVPPGPPAHVVLPTPDDTDVTESDRPVSQDDHVRVVGTGEALHLEVNSGAYRFRWPVAPQAAVSDHEATLGGR
jgi:alpha-L-rhamnosidase